MEYIKSKIRDVYDFPAKGVIFKDLTTVFKDPRALHIIGWDLSQLYRDKGVTKVVGIESRGFIGGSILAFELGRGFCAGTQAGQAACRHRARRVQKGVWRGCDRDSPRRDNGRRTLW